MFKVALTYFLKRQQNVWGLRPPLQLYVYNAIHFAFYLKGFTGFSLPPTAHPVGCLRTDPVGRSLCGWRSEGLRSTAGTSRPDMRQWNLRSFQTLPSLEQPRCNSAMKKRIPTCELENVMFLGGKYIVINVTNIIVRKKAQDNF